MLGHSRRRVGRGGKIFVLDGAAMVQSAVAALPVSLMAVRDINRCSESATFTSAAAMMRAAFITRFAGPLNLATSA